MMYKIIIYHKCLDKDNFFIILTENINLKIYEIILKTICDFENQNICKCYKRFSLVNSELPNIYIANKYGGKKDLPPIYSDLTLGNIKYVSKLNIFYFYLDKLMYHYEKNILLKDYFYHKKNVNI